MATMIRFGCPACGNRMRAHSDYAGRRTLCHGCGNKVRVSPEHPVPRALPYARPRLFAGLSPRPLDPGPEPVRTKSRGKLWASCICVLMILGGGFGIWRMGLSLEKANRAEEVAWANDKVAAKVKRAQDHLQRREWDQATRLLKEALATEGATDLFCARAVLRQTQESQAAALLAEADGVLGQKDTARASKLLEAYLAHPGAVHKDQAESLLGDIQLATSDSRAVDLLTTLPEDAFDSFLVKGTLAELERVGNPSLRALYQETLRRNLARAQSLRREIRERQEQERLARAEAERRRAQQERARRDAKVRGTPVYRELTDFIARARKKDQDQRRALEGHEKKLLEASAFLLNGNKQAANAAVLSNNLDRLRREQELEENSIRRWKETIEEQISKTRASIKERIRTYRGFDAADWAAFDQIVDWDLDGLWKEINKSADDDLEL
jgi:hypothetical protein